MSDAKHPIPESGLVEHIAIVGKVGKGKSYTAKGVVEHLVRSGKRVCVIDPGGDWWGLRADNAGSGPGLPIAVLGGTHGDVGISPESGPEVGKFIAGENLPCVVDVSEWYKTDQLRFMLGFAESIYKHNRKPLHLIIDEADQYSPQQPMGEGKKLLNRMEIIVRLGRKRGFRVMLITQRPAILHKNVLTQCGTLVAMGLTAPQDKAAIDAWIADNASAEEAKQVKSSLAKLPPGEGWVWSPGADLLKRIKFPRIKTFDSGRTPADEDEVIEPTNLAAIDLSALQKQFDAQDIADDTPTPKRDDANAAELRERLNNMLKIYDQLAQDKADLQQRLFEVDAFAQQLMQGLGVAKRYIEEAISKPPPKLDPDALPKPAIPLPPSRKPIGTTTTQARPAAVKRDATTELGAAASRLLDTLHSVWPVLMNWGQVCTLAQRKAKGGSFNTARKQLVEGGFVEERDGALVLTHPPSTDCENPIDAFQAALPTVAAELLSAIREHNGQFTVETLADYLDRAPRGGSWNSAMSLLTSNNLIVKDGAALWVNPELYPTTHIEAKT